MILVGLICLFKQFIVTMLSTSKSADQCPSSACTNQTNLLLFQGFYAKKRSSKSQYPPMELSLLGVPQPLEYETG